MAIRSFKVQRRSIKLAEANIIPPVMVIAGPNGVGKSTLLYAIKDGNCVIDEGTQIVYQGPHRVLRRTNIQRRWLGGGIRSILELLSGGDVTGYEGLNFPNSSRVPENVDEAGSTIKHTLGKIENKRQTLITSAVDRSQEKLFSEDRLDIYKPLRQLTKYLLPHLVFHKIDFTNEDDIKVLWERKSTAGSIMVDIDDLSSGEKSIIVLFLPLLESQLQDKLKALENIGSASEIIVEEIPPRVVLIDEPEQHLHPDLQAKILSYMRNISRTTPTQFIITTHSPTILDQAYDTELYILNPESEDENYNQLQIVASNAERLEALKNLTGSTYFLTTGRVIVCIEGEKIDDPDSPTDSRLLEILYPRATAVTLIPTKGKGNVITTVTGLRKNLPKESFKIKVCGLVDADQSTSKNPEGIEVMPVCMIENLLLNLEGIHEYLISNNINTFKTVEDLSKEFKKITMSLREKEIALRVTRRIKTKTVRLGGSSIKEIKENHAIQMKEIAEILPPTTELERIVNDVTTSIDQIIKEGRELDNFRGKSILKIFYRDHLSQKNISYDQACIDIAKIIATKNIVAEKLDPVFNRILS